MSIPFFPGWLVKLAVWPTRTVLGGFYLVTYARSISQTAPSIKHRLDWIIKPSGIPYFSTLGKHE